MMKRKFPMKRTSLLAVLALTSSLCALPVLAQQKATEKQPEKNAIAPDPKKIGVLNKLVGDNKGYMYDYLGTSGGVQNWLLSGPDIMQVVFVLPSQDSAIVGGAMIGPDGKEVSSALTRDFLKTHPERAKDIVARVKPPNAEAEDETTEQPAAGEPPEAEHVPENPEHAVVTPPDTGQPPVAPPAPPESETKLSPAETLWRDLGKTGRVTFGSAPGAPEIYALMDLAKPQTKEIWEKLAPFASDNRLIFHAVPMASTANAIMDVATVLGSNDPQKSWQRVMQGQPAAENNEAPDAKKAIAMKATIDLAKRLQLHQLPFIVYRSPGQKIRILRGLPKDWPAFLNELNLVPAGKN
ncbi:MAG: hypothetical protein JWM96_933 [Alphaproteobacteria bacterium]|nr:hypothetical protein [Alphaproteobacteria bacterium]